MKLGSKLLHHALADPLKVIGNILHIEITVLDDYVLRLLRMFLM